MLINIWVYIFINRHSVLHLGHLISMVEPRPRSPFANNLLQFGLEHRISDPSAIGIAGGNSLFCVFVKCGLIIVFIR